MPPLRLPGDADVTRPAPGPVPTLDELAADPGQAAAIPGDTQG
jgi:hypothetical protein